MNYNELYNKIREINVQELVYGKHKVQDEMRKILPQIQQFLQA